MHPDNEPDPDLDPYEHRAYDELGDDDVPAYVGDDEEPRPMITVWSPLLNDIRWANPYPHRSDSTLSWVARIADALDALRRTQAAPAPGATVVPVTTTPCYRCPNCWRTSANPNDLEHGFCGHCHRWDRDGPHTPTIVQRPPGGHPDGGALLPMRTRQRGWWTVMEWPPVALTAMTTELLLLVTPDAYGHRIAVWRREHRDPITLAAMSTGGLTADDHVLRADPLHARTVLGWPTAVAYANELMTAGPPAI